MTTYVVNILKNVKIGFKTHFVFVYFSMNLFEFLIEQDFVNGLEHRFCRRKQAEGNIKDVYDVSTWRILVTAV